MYYDIVDVSAGVVPKTLLYSQQAAALMPIESESSWDLEAWKGRGRDLWGWMVESAKMGAKDKSGKMGAHDIGGLEGEYGAIDRTEKGFHLWEMQVFFLSESVCVDFYQQL